ncbi:MAG TPA: thiamine biosynthesis protein ThiF [Blastocatellia bacterium]|jgi:adenylyltransferase/sulfurtransferase|nr:thiamine biosynthesis protein ThiF [Blastocatellia bacterium]HAF23852.1 thiamine biosynthesis protein ThiF [Blastocatellia bacterium]
MNERYSRQILFNGIGKEGQSRLLQARALIVGCGALGTAQAESLARAGVGRLRIADRDFVEASNLQRQTMFTERDAAERIPKAIAAANHIQEINPDIEVEPEITDVNHSNIERLVKDCDVVLDGTDNFATRYLINDACVKHKINWIYGAAVGSYGVTMTIQPHQTACLRCVFEEAPPAASAPTCDTAGVIMPIISVVAAVQVTEALKLLTGQNEELHRSLMQFDVWRNEWRKINPGPPSPDCPTCGLGNFTTLEAASGDFAAVLCGRNAVQISPSQSTRIDFEALAKRLQVTGEVKFNDYLLRFRTGEFEVTVFQDARSIIRGTNEIKTARSLYAKYIGN